MDEWRGHYLLASTSLSPTLLTISIFPPIRIQCIHQLHQELHTPLNEQLQKNSKQKNKNSY